MFARSSTIQAQTSMIDPGTEYVRDMVMSSMQRMDVFVGLSLMVNRGSGRCIATSAWRTQQAMRDSAAKVQDIRDAAADAFGGIAEVDEWEVAVMHRAHHARTGTCMRAVWSHTEPANVDGAIELFKHGALPRVEDLPGFCSASLMVNRSDGRACVTIAYDTRADMEANREAAAAIREDVSREGHMLITDVVEFDLAVAHLHIPETV